MTSINNSSEMRDTLTGLVDAGTTLRVPVWDVAQGSGSNLAYHVDRFILVTLTEINLPPGQGGYISATFIGEDPAACPEPSDLSIAKFVSPGQVWPGQTLTYTLAFSNAGAGPATGVVISDVLPLVLTDTHFTHSGAAITPTGGVTYAWQAQDLAPNEGGAITVTGQIRSDLSDSFVFTNTAAITGASVESNTGNNVGTAQTWVWVPPWPLIVSLNGTTFEVNTEILVRLEQHLPNGLYDIYLGTTAICTNVWVNGLGIWEGNCLIPADLAPGTYELTSTTPGGGSRVAGPLLINVTRQASATLLVIDGYQWPAGSPITLQLRSHAPHTVYELYFNGTLIGTTDVTNAYGDVDFPWIIPASTPPRESPDSYRIESHVVGSTTDTAHADIYVTTPQIVVQGGNTWPAGTTLRANLRRHAPNRSYAVRCNGVSVGSFTTDSQGRSTSNVLCTIPIAAPNSPPYYVITSYDGGVLIGHVNVTVVAAGQNCSVYPIAINVNSLNGLQQPGDNIGDVFNGAGAGNFGWLRWNDDVGSNSASYLAQELQDPTLSLTEFEEAGDPADTILNAGDWTWGLNGSFNSAEIRDTLIGLVDAGTTLRVPVWDVAQGTGSNLAYHVQRFVQIRLVGFHLGTGPSYGIGCATVGTCINAVFMGEDAAACPEPADLTVVKSVSPDVVQPGQMLTYTLAFSNAGAGPATGVVISDTLPLVLADTHFTHSGVAITSTDGVTYAWQVQDLGQNEGGVITVIGQVRSDLAGGFTFVNTATITGTSTETGTADNVSAATVLVSRQIYLPIIFKRG